LGVCGWQFIGEAITPERVPASGVASISGLPDRFFNERPRPQIDTSDPLGWMIAHCRDYGFEAVELLLEDHVDDAAEVFRLRDLLEKHDMTLTTDYGDDISAPTRSLSDFRRFVSAAVEIGATVIGVGGMPFTINRFVDDPPFATQMQMFREHLMPWVEIAEQAEMRLAVENHADYRCVELIEHVIEPIGSPFLGFKLDTGNCPLVIDDPVAAAELVAPRCFATHFKDMIVHPITPGGGQIAGAPIGLGHCQLDVVGRILAEHAPDPDSLVLCIEESSGWQPGSDYFQWIESSARWCAAEFRELLMSPQTGGR
jgi:sugar phosphate isomerase/epimerase